ncbi:hypothetical protein MG293_014640 [Ovis ammon polii]|uniref:Uncharacterized protein n=1 Tax=Ovis ammon polii TaxID=230172 RepID=A0AAD4U016_OVIAM|nr:hypothetical protein MG293_014640 [Ovis ammon polii]
MYCLAEVSPLRFRCTECQDIELCPCPGCFSAGAEIRRHHHHHHRCYRGYQLMDGGRFTLWGPEAMGAGPAARSSCCWTPPSRSDGALHILVAEQQQLDYVPLPDDYEIEYDQNAKTLISRLSVN